MTELKPGCVLWVNTKDLSMDYGHIMSDTCPLDDVCVGKRCAFLEPITTIAAQDAINIQKKLNNLRDELKNYMIKGDKFRQEL